MKHVLTSSQPSGAMFLASRSSRQFEVLRQLSCKGSQSPLDCALPKALKLRCKSSVYSSAGKRRALAVQLISGFQPVRIGTSAPRASVAVLSRCAASPDAGERKYGRPACPLPQGRRRRQRAGLASMQVSNNVRTFQHARLSERRQKSRRLDHHAVPIRNHASRRQRRTRMACFGAALNTMKAPPQVL